MRSDGFTQSVDLVAVAPWFLFLFQNVVPQWRYRVRFYLQTKGRMYVLIRAGRCVQGIPARATVRARCVLHHVCDRCVCVCVCVCV